MSTPHFGGVSPRAMQQRGQERVKAMYTHTRTFPTRVVASPAYRRGLVEGFEMMCEEQEDRFRERLLVLEAFMPEVGPLGKLSDYDCEVRR